jgi:hypothetical protein
MTFQEILPFLIPLAILQLTLMAIGLWDLSRPDRRVRGGNKAVWAVVIVVFQMLGPLAYFLVGREEA